VESDADDEEEEGGVRDKMRIETILEILMLTTAMMMISDRLW
jgi:hypothetical protein